MEVGGKEIKREKEGDTEKLKEKKDFFVCKLGVLIHTNSSHHSHLHLFVLLLLSFGIV